MFDLWRVRKHHATVGFERRAISSGRLIVLSVSPAGMIFRVFQIIDPIPLCPCASQHNPE